MFTNLGSAVYLGFEDRFRGTPSNIRARLESYLPLFAGASNVLDIFRNGIDSALLGLGRSSVSELEPADVLVPPGFVRRLGAPPE